jgi:FtsP/CotA-like multicopper oxidase with cupredoxin domain
MRLNIQKLVLIFVGLSLVIFIILFYNKNYNQKNTTVMSAELREELLAEFKEAYPKKIQETGKAIEFPITAQESPINLPTGKIINSWTYNGSTPGPEIRISLGDTIKIPFTNHLPQPTTIHFHGVRVPNAMDGVPSVTQEEIPPNGTFVYEFTPKDAGTFWFHPHVRGSEQVERGLYGTLIVEDDYSKNLDQDKVVVLDDWRLSSETKINEDFNHPHDVSHDGRWGDLITANNKETEIITGVAGEHIRLRLVNAANGRVFEPIFSTPVEIVAIDGMYLEAPLVYEGLEIAPGNRLDIELKLPANTKEIEMYDKVSALETPLIRIKIDTQQIAKTDENHAYPKDIEIPDWNNPKTLEASPDYEYVLGGNGGHMMSSSWAINGDVYGKDTAKLYKEDKPVKVRFRNNSLRYHPMHLHGQFFKVIARNDKPVDENYWRDTVIVHGSETVDVIMIPIDIGKWAMHCHILEHAEAGMMTTFDVN